MFAAYTFIFTMVFLAALPFLILKMLVKGKYLKSFRQKLGRVPLGLAGLPGSPRIWVYAVSVGEVSAISPVVRELRSVYPEACIVVSTGTETGQEMARNRLPEASGICYMPLDFPWALRRFFDAIRPGLLITTEAEFWPNLMHTARARGVKTMLANGRISESSFRGYMATRWLWRRVLGDLDRACVQDGADARRLRAMGARPEIVRVAGNCKFDALVAQTASSDEEEIREALTIPEGTAVFVAGSTHRGEEEAVLATYRRLRQLRRDAVLILAPRHVERIGSVEELLRRRAMVGSVRRSELAPGARRVDQHMILLDTIGELFKVYSVASIVFCGGSLVPRGGQNILEPAAWGKVVLYGPHMDDFLEARNVLEPTGAGITIHSPEELSAKALGLIQNEKDLARRGEAARRVLSSSRGAASRCVEAAQLLLGSKPGT